jgi:hypothetical protein
MSILLHRNMTSIYKLQIMSRRPMSGQILFSFLERSNHQRSRVQLGHCTVSTTRPLQAHTHTRQQQHNAAYHINMIPYPFRYSHRPSSPKSHPPYRFPTLGSTTLPLASPFAFPYLPALALSCTRLISLTSPKFAAGSSARPCLSTSSAVMPGTCSRMP